MLLGLRRGWRFWFGAAAGFTAAVPPDSPPPELPPDSPPLPPELPPEASTADAAELPPEFPPCLPKEPPPELPRWMGAMIDDRRHVIMSLRLLPGRPNCGRGTDGCCLAVIHHRHRPSSSSLLLDVLFEDVVRRLLCHHRHHRHCNACRLTCRKTNLVGPETTSKLVDFLIIWVKYSLIISSALLRSQNRRTIL